MLGGLRIVALSIYSHEQTDRDLVGSLFLKDPISQTIVCGVPHLINKLMLVVSHSITLKPYHKCLTFCLLVKFACFLSFADFFFKINLFKNIFQEYCHSVKQLTVCIG